MPADLLRNLPVASAPRPLAARFPLTLFVVVCALHFAGAVTGWRQGMLPGHTFRQAQTALSTYHIQQDGGHAFDYPTPVLGKPWSVPMEFPLYQWAVVALNNFTGGPLVESARTISLLCFYLTLPALWLFLRELGVDPARRWLVLAFAPACPVFIFYARAFLIESMALMFSVWFGAALLAGVKQRAAGWLLVAALAGCGAGLVKVTTFLLFLVPTGLALAWQLRTALTGATLKRGPARGRLLLAAAATLLPVLVTVAWVLYADGIKADNPGAEMLRSGPQRTYNFGHFADRFSGDYWRRWIDLSTRAVFHPTLGAAVAILALAGARRWRPFVAGSLALFVLAPAIFPLLYAWHDYYYFANALFFALACGFGALAVLDSRLPRWLGAVLIAGALLLQGHQYRTHYLAEQRVAGNGDSGLTRALFDLTSRDDVLVIAGQDWDSWTAWNTRRRTLTIPRVLQNRSDYLAQAFDNLRGEFVAALVLTGSTRDHVELVRLAESRLGIHPQPFFGFEDSVVYVHSTLRREWSSRAQTHAYENVRVLAPVQSVAPLLSGEVRALHGRSVFAAMSPQPVGFDVPYGLSTLWPATRPLFNAHVPTHLRFEPAARRYRVKIEFGILDSAWQRAGRTDGVEFALFVHRADGTSQKLWNRLLDPATLPGDRGLQTADFVFDLPDDNHLRLSTLPGPSGVNSFDWAYIAGFELL